MGYWDDMEQRAPDSKPAAERVADDLSVVEHRNLLAQQNGVCAICREPGLYLCVDHDHKTGRVRALLCIRCNVAIGYLRESPLLARAAATYLEQQLTKEFTGE